MYICQGIPEIPFLSVFQNIRYSSIPICGTREKDTPNLEEEKIWGIFEINPSVVVCI